MIAGFARNGWLAGAALGIAAAAVAVGTQGMSTKGLVIVVAALVACAVFPWLVLHARGRDILVVLLAVFIPLAPNLNFFLAADHVGGAASVEIQAAGLIVLCLAVRGLLLFYVRRPASISLDWPLVAAVVLYGAIGALSVVNAAYPVFTAFELFRFVQLFGAFLILALIADGRTVRLFLVAIAVGAIVQGGLGAAQFVLGRGLGLGFLGEQSAVLQDIGFVANRASGTIGHPNQLGYFFEILIPVFLALCLGPASLRWRVLFAIALSASVMGLMFTLSRGAWLSLPISCVLVVGGLLYARAISRAGMVFLGSFAVAALVALMVAWPTIEARITANDHQSSASRAPLNAGALSVIARHPMLGIGLNNFSEVFHELDTTGNARIFRAVDGTGRVFYYKQVVHNMYLLVWAEIGIFGLAAFLAQFVMALRRVPGRRLRATPQPHALLIGIAAGLVAHLIHGLFDPGFKVTYNISMLIYCLLGLVAAVNVRQLAMGNIWTPAHEQRKS